MVNGGEIDGVRVLGHAGMNALHSDFSAKRDVGFLGVRTDYSRGGINRFK